MGVTIGAPAPDFVLKDQSQKEVKLSDFRGKKNVVVVFSSRLEPGLHERARLFRERSEALRSTRCPSARRERR